MHTRISSTTLFIFLCIFIYSFISYLEHFMSSSHLFIYILHHIILYNLTYCYIPANNTLSPLFSLSLSLSSYSLIKVSRKSSATLIQRNVTG
mmetsp:Transcript_8225/g.8392  ORF Transcript_8225/g.8392 Transcript_8225/m.8392 type:complete len:92 (-) Transcript_8225:29-304(-)